MEQIGCCVASRLTAALTGNGIPYQKLVDIIYKEFTDISNEQEDGCWLEFPNGDSYTKTYTAPKSTK